MNRWLAHAAVVATLALLPAAAGAQGALTGRVLDEIERPIPGLQVRAWADAPDGKGRVMAGESLSDDAGAWRIEPLDTGRYQVHVRMPNGMEGNWADRWLDNEDPFASGWVAEDADWIEVADGQEVAVGDVLMVLFGGLDGRVLTGGEALAGVRVRAETLDDCRRNHVDETDTGADSDGHRLGRYSFRGLVPGPTRLIAWHPSGDLETAALVLPFEVVAEQNPQADDFELAPLPDDPHEPNDAPAEVGAGAPDAGGFAEVPPRPWRTGPGARIAPRGGGDLDWYCLYADDGDRYVATVTASVPGDLGPPCDEHPWIDPMVSFWRIRADDAEPVLLVADDDSGPGRRGAKADTGLLAEGGRVCALVSTYGDAAWDGQGRQSWGDYSLEIRMGNRLPQLDVLHRDQPAPAVVRVTEGDALCLDVRGHDPDGDALQVHTELRDKAGAVVQAARYVPDDGAPAHSPAGRWCWTAGPRAGDDSPFVLDAFVRDAEFGAKAAVRIEAQVVNQPPTVPTLVTPADGERLDQAGAVLVIEHSEDADGDPLKYHFEVHVGGVGGVPEHTASLPEVEGADVTSWQTPPLPDEARVCWRARADDGRPGGLSDWSEAWCFLMDADNAPPPTPRWNKPVDGQLVYVSRPTLSVWAVEDPERDPVEIELELAASDDQQFEAPLDSARLAQDPRSPTVGWRADVDLVWGRSYLARARAHDSRGGSSAWTPPASFRLKPNRAPTPALLRTPDLDAICRDTVLSGPLPDPLVLKSPYDPEGDAIVLQVQIQAAGAATAVLDVERELPGLATLDHDSENPGHVEIPTTDVALEEGRRYVLRVRTGDGQLFGRWSECEFWVDRETAPVTDLRIVHPAPDARVPGPDRVEAIAEHSGWPDATLPDRRLEATWTFCKTYPAPPTPEEGCVEDGPLPFGGNEVRVPLGLLDLGHYTLEVCARSAAASPDAQGPCIGEASSTFKVVHEGNPSSSCDCAVGGDPGGPTPAGALSWLLLGLLAIRRGWRRARPACRRTAG